MKTTLIFVMTLSILSLTSLSCQKEETIAKPEIQLVEVGYDNTGTVTVETDLHLEAEVTAEGRISVIRVILHPEGEHGMKIAATGGWEFDSTYTEFIGLKNCEFHKHIPIPALADTGMYHLDFTVTDQEGNQSSVDSDVRILPKK